ncbi:phosphate acyltransferase PlsX [Pokkaliibacter sp. CJK22405]|uniref:phosphate acyltransferase PlsX n=1 Tax=Pokkaliibacter sp. CJK22405 TaxID=3384615 RepID=UPI00398502FA
MPLRSTIAVDVMGGDFGPRVTLPAVSRFSSQYPDSRFILCGNESVISDYLVAEPELSARIEVVVSSNDVAMADKPSVAIRTKRESSSMALALKQVASGRADAVVSAGNTGALMAMGCMVLDRLHAVDRPAITTTIPTRKGQCMLLDLGANLDASPKHLCQYAVMGAAIAKARGLQGLPKIALLNVGEEAGKGGQSLQKASQWISLQNNLEYCGFVEGDSMFSGDYDVVVCNGFVGNVALKTGEGVAQLIVDSLRDHLASRWYTKALAALLMPALKQWGKRFEPAIYNGAIFAGLKGNVVKSHGAASDTAFFNALSYAARLTQLKLPEKLQAALVESDRVTPFDEQ